MTLPPELVSVVGIAAVGIIGDIILVKLGKQYLAIAWDIIISIAGAIVGLDFAWDAIKNKIGPVFGVNIR